MATEEHREASKKVGRGPLTPAKRSRLDRLYEAAQKKASGLKPNYDYASELYAQCVVGNPGNDVFVKAYVENLHKKYNNNRTGATLANFKERGARNAVKKALTNEQWDEVIKNGLKVLAVNPWDIHTLTAMAHAAKKSGDFECEMYYLKTALTANPKDPTVNRLCAIAAGERLLYDQAIYCWHRVEEADPHDEEAKRSISYLQTEKMKKKGSFIDESDEDKHLHAAEAAAGFREEELSAEKKFLNEIAKDPKQIPLYYELSQLYLHEDRFDKAEEILARAFEASNGDPDVREKWEDAQLRTFRHKIINTADAVKKRELQQEYYHKELDFFKRRCERYPNNLFFRYDLGVRYFLTRQYNEAIRELQLSRNDPRRKGVSILALGKCFQQIEQNRLALSHYTMAAEEIPERDINNKKEALRLAGKIALTLGEIDAAEKQLSILAAMDFSYKDVSALLDKVAEVRKNQLAAEEKPDSEAPPEDDRGE
jgi:lipopolysaccharide biosynthesis regulator YciM